jgi:hypothetical protein
MGHAKSRAICQLASQESPRRYDEKTGCASSQLAIPPRRAGAKR